ITIARAQLKAARLEWSQLLRGKHTTEQRKASQNKIRQRESELNALLQERSRQDPHYSSLFMANAVDIRAIQSLIVDDDSAIIEYFLGENTSAVWTITRTEFTSNLIRTSRKTIEALVGSTHDDLAENSCRVKLEAPDEQRRRLATARQKYFVHAAELSKILLSPILKTITRHRHIAIVSDGGLQQLSFAALPLPPTAEMLVDSHVITYTPSV